jgi:eukaryotic-like serine/threonine-protein kinase
MTKGNLISMYLEVGRPEKALPLLGAFVAGERKLLEADPAQFAALLNGISRRLMKHRQFAAAEPLLREGLAIREKAQPDAWGTFDAQSQFGGALLGQQKYDEAEPFLLRGYAGLKQREKAIPPQARDRAPEALDRLVELYAATNKSDEVTKWRSERAKYPPERAKYPPERAPRPRPKE